MKKVFLAGLTALAVISLTPVSTQAATLNRSNVQKNYILTQKSTNRKDLNLRKSILCTNGTKINCNYGTLIWSGNCPGIVNPAPGKPTPEKPTPEKPTPEKPTPEQPGNKPSLPGTGEENLSYMEQVAKLVNTERQKAGLSPLSVNKNIEAAALVRSKEIQTSFSHTRPNGSNFATALKENNVSYSGSGENIAWGQKSPEDVMKSWMNSPSHKANILNKNYKNIGVGHSKTTSGTDYWVQLFTY